MDKETTEDTTEEKQTEKIIAWCCKCKEKREMKDIEVTESKKGVEMRRGTCVVCEGKMCRFGGLK